MVRSSVDKLNSQRRIVSPDVFPTVFVNLFYEYNNPGLDAGMSNLKCAAYADVHTAVRKTNFGGQQLAPTPAGLTYIRRSSGWGVKSLLNPSAPENYELTYGPIDFANNAPGVCTNACFLD